jgi:hypothetical protein
MTQTLINALTILNTVALIWFIYTLIKTNEETRVLTDFELNFEDIKKEIKDEKKSDKTTKLRGSKSPKAKKAGKSSPIRARKETIKFKKAPKETKRSQAKEKSRRSVEPVHKTQGRKKAK